MSKIVSHQIGLNREINPSKDGDSEVEDVRNGRIEVLEEEAVADGGSLFIEYARTIYARRTGPRFVSVVGLFKAQFCLPKIEFLIISTRVQNIKPSIFNKYLIIFN